MADAPATLSQDLVVGIKVHATDEHTPETILAAHCVRSIAGTPGFPDLSAERFERPNIGKDLEREPGRVTKKKSGLPHSEEILANVTTPGDPPYFDAPLQACGFQRKAVRRIQIDSAAGFLAGEVCGDNAAQESATKTAVVVSVETVDGDPDEHYLLYVVLAGDEFADGDTITGYESSASEDVTTGATPANSGHLYHPLTESTGVVPPAATVVHFRGGREYGAICRGDCVMRFAEANPGVIDFTLSGPLLLDEDGFPQGDPPANIPVVPAVAPLATGAAFVLDVGGDDFEPPILSTFELRVGNTVSDRATITDGSIGTTGYAAPRIRQRQSVLTFNPEDVADATHDIVQKAFSGDTLRLDFRYGDWLAAGGKVAAHVYAFQYDAPDYQDAEGVMQVNINAPVRRGPRIDWPYYLAVLFGPSS